MVYLLNTVHRGLQNAVRPTACYKIVLHIDPVFLNAYLVTDSDLQDKLSKHILQVHTSYLFPIFTVKTSIHM
jgi:hypothetical protein